jgi:lysozyme family protein|tara:strand:+ start:461 stop:697 length:237 start_codon:yes stop_codon:yes gene_type:complete
MKDKKLETLQKALNNCYERRVDVILGDSDETIEAIEKERRALMDAYSPGISEREVYETFGVPKSYFDGAHRTKQENEE